MKLKPFAILSALMLAMLGATTGARAQSDYPSKPIRIMVSAGPATAPDVVARAMAEELAKQMGVAVSVENREGAGGNIAHAAAAKAPADGYNLLLGSSTMVTSVHLVNPQPFSPVRDFIPLGRIGEIPLLAVVGAESRFKTWADVVNYSRANPGKMNFATMGKGSASHLFTATLEKEFAMTGVDVSYKSVNQGIIDTSTGKVDMYLANLPPAIGLLQAGKLRASGVGSTTRLPALPDVPTFAEITGKPGYRAVLWYGTFVPTGTPPAIIARLTQEVAKAAATPSVKARIEAAGGVISIAPGKDMHEQLEADYQRFGNLAKELGLVK